ncbi:hypothetical protein Fot_37639 [Forsythia ovata]|uniref:Uncharacterized protein n=1 Tax=Forsythia ovata TaxID=205694 RepID=A0ABD1S206_9LAMI
MAKLIAEEATDLQKQMEESARQRKGKWIAGPSGVENLVMMGSLLALESHRVNLGLESDEIDLVEGWVEHVRELAGRHEVLDFDPESWACNKYHSDLNLLDFTKLRDHYRVPEGVRLIFPNKIDRPCSLPEEHITIMRDSFSCRMSLPFHPFFRAILRSYNIIMDILRSSSLSKFGLAGLAAKKIHLIEKTKSLDNDKKWILAELCLKCGEKDQDAPPASFDPRQTVLVPSALPQGLQIIVQK